MKKSRFTEEQSAFALRQAELGTSLAEVCLKMRCCRGRLFSVEAETPALEEENLKLKRPRRHVTAMRRVDQDLRGDRRRRDRGPDVRRD
jgi:putative transposase